MPRHRRLHGERGGFVGAHLAHHEYIGVMSQDRAQRRCEGDTGFSVYGDLRDSGQLVLDRVFYCDELFTLGVAETECRVECGSLSGPGGPSHEQHAVRPARECRNCGQDVMWHAQFVEPYRPATAIKEPEHHAFPVHCGHRRDPEIELGEGEAHTNASVLRAPAFGDVQFGEKLDARDHGVRQPRRCLGRRDQHTVQAEAGGEPRAARFEVDVARARISGVAHEQVHVAHDRRLRGEIADISREGFIAVRSAPEVIARQLDQAIRFGRQALDEAFDVISWCGLGHHLAAVGNAQIIECVGEQRAWCRGDDKRAVLTQGARADGVIEEVLAGHAWREWRKRCAGSRNRSGTRRS